MTQLLHDCKSILVECRYCLYFRILKSQLKSRNAFKWQYWQTMQRFKCHEYFFFITNHNQPNPSMILRPCIHRLFPYGVCPFSLLTRHTDNEPLFCLSYRIHMLYPLGKTRFIFCVARCKGTRPYGTREQLMDTGP